MNIVYILIILIGISANIKVYIIDDFKTLKSCQKAEFKVKDQDGVYNAFCIEREIK